MLQIIIYTIKKHWVKLYNLVIIIILVINNVEYCKKVNKNEKMLGF